MAKLFSVLIGPNSVTTSGKTTIINSSQVDAYLTDSDTDTELDKLPPEAKQVVLNAMFRLRPGESRKPISGTYNLNYAYSYALPTSVLVTE